MSAPTSPLAPHARRLSLRRRGSMAAPDPLGMFPDTERGMSSTLHIIKAPPTVPVTDLDERARIRTTTNNVQPRARSHSGGSNGARISFAFSGFTPVSSPKSSASEATRPASPLNTGPRVPRSNSFTTTTTTTPHTTLTPVQIYELAQQCNHPQSRPPTPGGNVIPPATPVVFTPLPDTHLLPFLDRAGEVQDLLSTPPTSRLFLLLAQTFPPSMQPGADDDPASWTYAQLERWLTKIDRSKADDAEWVHKTGLCISTRSELIWERVKSALGVPPELNFSYNDVDRTSAPIEQETFSEEPTEYFGDAWVEPIVASPLPSPLPSVRTPTGGPFRRPSSSASRHSVGRMQDISEDEPEPVSSSTATVHGLRLVTSPGEPPARRYSHPSPSSAGSFSHSQVPYDAVAERGPGHPLFPTSFANLALGPTLKANNPVLRSPPVPPASAYPLTSRRRQVASWAEGWDLQKQEYAVSVASESSRRSIHVE